jgi:hypothetical protein
VVDHAARQRPAQVAHRTELVDPRALLVGRRDPADRFRPMGRTTPLPRTDAAGLADLLTFESEKHPWKGWSFSAGWGSREPLVVHLVRPELVVEVAADVAVTRPAGGGIPCACTGFVLT